KLKQWIANPIDAFVLAELEARGLKPSPPADKRELVRRVYFDLIGLPPTPEQVAAFVNDASSGAYEKLTDYLLSLPQYGERWARHWLDVVRFAQSNGYERDGEKPLAWRYRDYVVKSFNEDKPYDRFVLEQLAGDELEEVTNDSIIATGFYRLGVWDDEPDDKRMALFEELDDVIVSTSAAFLGVTMGCARCHDHKFDPVSQKDYYQFLSFFRNVRPAENANYTLESANYSPLASAEKIERWHAEQQVRIKPLEAELAGATTEEDKKKLKEKIQKVKDTPSPFEWALSVRENGSKPAPTHILLRGNAGTPGAEVEPAFLTVLAGQKPDLLPRSGDAQSTGRRLALAKWIASSQNPLTARVMVNRIWQHHFGKGIVKTTTDFGRAGVPPTHPKLLDWLAADFVDGGWSIKRMHRLILLSSAYRMSSRIQNDEAVTLDPGNDLLWRQNLRRLEAESIRDTILAISGQLNLTMGGRGFFPHLGGEVLAGESRPGLDWEPSSEPERSRRSLYTFIRRTMLAPVLENFDYSNTATPLGERPVTTVSPQALMLLNDEFMQRQAASFASRLEKEAAQDANKQVCRAYQLALGRDPTTKESLIALSLLKRQAERFAAIRSRVTFRPDVPFSLEAGYMGRLSPMDFLIGPRENWSYYRGHWSKAYESIRTTDRARGPFALFQGERIVNGSIEARIMLHNSCEIGAFLFRGSTDGDLFQGYEVTFEPRQQRVSLRRHSAEPTVLAEVSARFPSAQPFPVAISFDGPRVRVWINGGERPLFDVVDSQPVSGPGLIGVRSWGAALSLDDLTIATSERKVSVAGESEHKQSQQRALESFCLLLLNLNEVVYVD
ncbi:MAG: DUF1549 and DUF1553 domain-containing protein, partial [Verrucomicrobiota bacterium]